MLYMFLYSYYYCLSVLKIIYYNVLCFIIDPVYCLDFTINNSPFSNIIYIIKDDYNR